MNLKTVLSFDLLQDIRHQTGRRISLENLAVPTLKIGKSADGLQALKWYQEGKIDEIIHYCKQDVQVTVDLLRFGMENGYVLGAVKGAIVKIPINWKNVI